VNEALKLESARRSIELRLRLHELRLSQGTPTLLLRLDVASHKAEVNDLLLRVSDLMRAQP